MSTAQPCATATHGFHRQLQALNEENGPPWIHSISGAGPSPSAGRQSQPRTVAPSTSVATSVSRPGGAGTGAGVGSATGCWSSAAVSSRTGTGGASTVERSA